MALPPGPVSARRLIEAAVMAEVAAFEARAEEASLVGVLTERSLVGDLERGAVRLGDAGPAGSVDLARAVETALVASPPAA